MGRGRRSGGRLKTGFLHSVITKLSLLPTKRSYTFFEYVGLYVPRLSGTWLRLAVILTTKAREFAALRVYRMDQVLVKRPKFSKSQILR